MDLSGDPGEVTAAYTAGGSSSSGGPGAPFQPQTPMVAAEASAVAVPPSGGVGGGAGQATPPAGADLEAEGPEEAALPEPSFLTNLVQQLPAVSDFDPNQAFLGISY